MIDSNNAPDNIDSFNITLDFYEPFEVLIVIVIIGKIYCFDN